MRNVEKIVLKRFLKETESHQMKVLRDEGVYRHLSFRKPGTIIYGFDLITWPGHLSITGDCGAWVFQRVVDMFEFFSDKSCQKSGAIGINPSYWSEKIVACNRHSAGMDTTHGGAAEFDSAALRRILAEYVTEAIQESPFPLTKKNLADIWEEFRDRFDGEISIEDRLELQGSNFEVELWDERFNRPTSFKVEFNDLWEHNPHEWRHDYIWNLYAIVWGIKKYKESKANGQVA